MPDFIASPGYLYIYSIYQHNGDLSRLVRGGSMNIIVRSSDLFEEC